MKNDQIIKKLDEIKSSIEEKNKATDAAKTLKLINKYIHFHIMKGDNNTHYIQATIANVGLITTEINIKDFNELYNLLKQLYL